MPKVYPLADFMSNEEIERSGLEYKEARRQSMGYLSEEKRKIGAVSTGEYRAPRKGEWFLSGADVEAYRALGDLTTEYHIAKLVKINLIASVEVKNL